MTTPGNFIETTRRWVENVVIDLNLCPFAKRELINNRVRFALSDAHDIESLLRALCSELNRLSEDGSIETTLLIHPSVLVEFTDYNQFLDLADALLADMQLHGIYQLASFHPQYRFEGTAIKDVENYSNRSPYPMLHLIREASLEQAVAHYPNPERIPERNIALLKELGRDTMQALLKDCYMNTTPKKTTRRKH